MNREEAKKLVKNFYFIKAFAEGKTIGYKYPCDDTVDPNFTDDPDNYYIKPEPKWRAWKDDEGPERLIVHDSVERNYVILSKDGACYRVIPNGCTFSKVCLFKSYNWLHEDGTITPCGVLEDNHGN